MGNNDNDLLLQSVNLPEHQNGEVVEISPTKQAGVEFLKIMGGMASLGKGGLIKQGNALLQAWLQGRFSEEMDRAIDRLKAESKFDDDAAASDLFTASFSEVLNYLETDKTGDVDRLKIIVRLFSLTVTKGTPEADRLLAHELIKVARVLSGMEIRILRGAYDLSQSGKRLAHPGSWASEIANRTGLSVKYLVYKYEEHLVELQLIAPRTGQNNDTVGEIATGRLTDFGLKLCDFVDIKNPM